jgi:hypothetical protein
VRACHRVAGASGRAIARLAPLFACVDPKRAHALAAAAGRERSRPTTHGSIDSCELVAIGSAWSNQRSSAGRGLDPVQDLIDRLQPLGGCLEGERQDQTLTPPARPFFTGLGG